MQLAINQKAYFWEHPELTRFTGHIEPNANLFRQGDSGNWMFIVLTGSVEIIAEFNGRERRLSFVTVGEFIGEQALINPTNYKRAFTARAKSDVTAIKMAMPDVFQIQTKAPKLASEIWTGI